MPVQAQPGGGPLRPPPAILVGALYCRVVTEGLFGITPTGLSSFRCAPRLPEAWDHMALRSIRAFGRDFDLIAERAGDMTVVRVEERGQVLFDAEWDGGEALEVCLGGGPE